METSDVGGEGGGEGEGGGGGGGGGGGEGEGEGGADTTGLVMWGCHGEMTGESMATTYHKASSLPFAGQTNRDYNEPILVKAT